jgi:hypothetical protein
MPFFNRDRARCGDLVAGTLVVVKPEGVLLPDMAEGAEIEAEGADSPYAFSGQQLGMYGIKELQVLEDILRRGAGDRERKKLIHTVTGKIVRKIGWQDPVPRKEEFAFLQAFYRAQRYHLEQRLLLGERREKKRKGRLSD